MLFSLTTPRRHEYWENKAISCHRFTYCHSLSCMCSKQCTSGVPCTSPHLVLHLHRSSSGHHTLASCSFWIHRILPTLFMQSSSPLAQTETQCHIQNLPGGSTLQCDTWLWDHVIEFSRWQHPAMWHVTVGEIKTLTEMMTEMSWEVDEEVNRDENGDLVRLTEWIWKLIPKTRWCITKWAICDFQGGDGSGARKSDNRWGAGTARRLKRDKVAKIARLSSCKNFVRERSLYSMRSLTFSQWRDLRMGVIWVDLVALTTARAREFWICWSRLSWQFGRLW